MKRQQFLRLGATLALSLSTAFFLSACNKPAVQFQHVDITGADYAKSFTLKDASGKIRTLADFKGKLVLVFFGYTQCPDVCPTTMTEMSGVMKALGKDADKLQVIFITLDPERDTPALLAQYVPAFDARFLGLYGSVKETEDVARDFKIFFKKVPGKNGNYSIDHTAASYVFDREGNVRLFVRNGTGAAAVASDLKLLLQ
ncbi:MAG: SCO family protein [Burkholderiales bacterium]|nr:SCO family protein [Burkholderiales bacterium]